MKQLKFLEEIFEAEKIFVHADSIVGITNGVEVFSFKGISDFTRFELEEGQKFDTSSKPLEEEVSALKDENISNMLAMTEMFEENLRMQEANAKLQDENNSTMLALTELYELVMNGGTM